MLLNSSFSDGSIVTDSGDEVSLKDLLAFFSAAEREPPLGFKCKPSMRFIDGDLATSSTCDLVLRLPLNHLDYENFKEGMLLSIMGHDGFGRV